MARLSYNTRNGAFFNGGSTGTFVGPLGATQVKLTRQHTKTKVIDVACPDCKADIGVRCVDLNGATLAKNHAVRKRMAVRADNARREAEGLLAPGAEAAVEKRGAAFDPSPDAAVCPACETPIKTTATANPSLGNPAGVFFSHAPGGVMFNRRSGFHCLGSYALPPRS